MDGLPLSSGARGEAVRDIQRRLSALGADLAGAEAGRFDDATIVAVEKFQHERGLPTTGVCDSATWSALVEAGYRLGDRLLYLRSPMLRGDDVAQLQLRLGSLGFDAGRIDGIFGPDTERALRDFQRNGGLTTDAVCGRDVLDALQRLGTRQGHLTGVAGVREREALRHRPMVLTGRRIAISESGGLDAVASAIGRILHESGAVVAVSHHPEPSVQAAEANTFAAELYLGLEAIPDGPVQCAYYATTGFESLGGRRFAELITDTLTYNTGLGLTSPKGMRLDVLRETRMPAVFCQLGPISEVATTSATVASSLARAIERWVTEPDDL